MITTHTIITNVQYGVPSGNYDGSSLDFITDPTIGSGYYQGYGSITTVRMNLTNFKGVITAQASLNDFVNSAIYFKFENERFVATSPETGIFVMNLVGNFVWNRFEISDFTQGTINSITVSY